MSAFSFRTRGKSEPEGQQWELTASDRSAFHRSVTKDFAEADVIDDRTWSDLEMEKVYSRLNKCVTPLGAQHLYALLKNYEVKQATLEENAKSYQTFKSNPDIQAGLRSALAKLNRQESADLADFLLGAPPTIPTFHRFFYFASVLAIACPFGFFLSPWFCRLQRSSGASILSSTIFMAETFPGIPPR